MRDLGKGMTQENIVKTMNGHPISTRGTKGEKGTGLGMIVIKDIIKRNQGHFHLENVQPGLKATFKFPAYGQ